MNRRLNLESLEHRLLLAADVAFQNPLLYQDGILIHVSQVDALQVINHLNTQNYMTLTHRSEHFWM